MEVLILLLVGIVLILIFKSTTKKQNQNHLIEEPVEKATQHKDNSSYQLSLEQKKKKPTWQETEKANDYLNNVVNEWERDIKTKIVLDIPNKEIEKAKSLGVKYDGRFKRWYVPSNIDTTSFEKWISEDEHIIPNTPLYLMSAMRSCWDCGNSVKVFCLASNSFNELYSKHYNVNFNSYGYLKQVSLGVSKILKQKVPTYKKRYSKQTDCKYYTNHCSCGAPQGDNYLHHEEDSVFGINVSGAERNLIFSDLDKDNIVLAVGSIYEDFFKR